MLTLVRISQSHWFCIPNRWHMFIRFYFSLTRSFLRIIWIAYFFFLSARITTHSNVCKWSPILNVLSFDYYYYLLDSFYRFWEVVLLCGVCVPNGSISWAYDTFVATSNKQNQINGIFCIAFQTYKCTHIRTYNLYVNCLSLQLIFDESFSFLIFNFEKVSCVFHFPHRWDWI